MDFKKIRRILDRVDSIVEPRETLIYGAINVFSGGVVFYGLSFGSPEESQALINLVILIGAASYGASYGKLISKKY